MPYRKFALIAVLCCAAAAASAQPQVQPSGAARLEAVYACAGVADDAERLACFDAAVGTLRAEQQRGEIAVIDRQGAREVEREAFGFSMPNLARMLPFRGGDGNQAAASTSEQFEIARVTPRADNRAAFTMSNGQVWTMVEAESYRRVRAGAQVTIRRAALGSYFMQVADTNLGFRVRREE